MLDSSNKFKSGVLFIQIMLEAIINPKSSSAGPWKMLFIGLLYASLSILLVHWFFSGDFVLAKYSGMIVVTFCVMFSLPYMYYLIKQEESEDEAVEGILSVWRKSTAVSSKGALKQIIPSSFARRMIGSCHSQGVCASRYSS